MNLTASAATRAAYQSPTPGPDRSGRASGGRTDPGSDPHSRTATGDGDELWQNVMLYKDQRPDVEVGVLVSAPFQAEGRVIPSALPAGEVATATHRGDYAKLGVTHDAVRDYAAAHGRELAGPCWEIYGHARPDPSEAKTEVFWLLR